MQYLLLGHIQKRIRTGLRSYENKKRGMELADGGSLGGRHRVTDSVVSSLYAIVNNNNNVKAMQDAVRTIFCHCILDEHKMVERQHRLGHPGSDSWCKYQQDMTANTNTYIRRRRLRNMRKQISVGTQYL